MLSTITLRGLILLCGVFVGSLGWGGEVKELFVAEVPAFSGEPEDRAQALHDALAIVLQRVLVGDEIFSDSTVAEIMAQPVLFLLDESSTATHDPARRGSPARKMRFQFDGDRLLEALKTSRWAIWNEIRPETLLWLVIERGISRQFFEPSTMPDWAADVRRAAQQWGLPVRYPRFDAKERQQIDPRRILQPGYEVLLQSAAHYPVVAVLAGRLIDRQWCWESQWRLYFDQREYRWAGECATPFATLLDGLRGVHRQLGRFYGVKPVYANARVPIVPAKPASSPAIHRSRKPTR